MLRWRILLRFSSRGDTSTDKPQSALPWYEGTLLWGAISVAATLIATYVGYATRDIMWILVAAWPFCALVALALARAIGRFRLMLTLAGSLLAAAGLFGISKYLPPPTDTDIPTQIRQGFQSLKSQAAKQLDGHAQGVSDPKIDRSGKTGKPPTAPDLPLTFKPSPLLTEARRQRISETIRDFRHYLMSVGFTIPDQVPPIGVSKSSTIFGMSPGVRPAMPEDYNMILSAKDADDEAKIRSAYSLYVFQGLFGWIRLWPDLAKNAGKNVLFVAFLFSDYYTFSYSNHYVEESPKTVDRQWLNALWGIREKYGKQFADKAMYYSYKKWLPPDPQEDGTSFNKFFFLRFLSGVEVEVTDPQQYIEIQNIYAAQGLPGSS
jgi:hypothetical protein